MGMAPSVVKDIMKPRRDANGNYIISNDKLNYMKMTVAGRKFDNIHEMALFGVSVKAEEHWNRLINDIHALMEDLEMEAYRIANIK